MFMSNKRNFFSLELTGDRFDRIQPSKTIGNVLWHRGNRICIHREKKGGLSRFRWLFLKSKRIFFNYIFFSASFVFFLTYVSFIFNLNNRALINMHSLTVSPWLLKKKNIERSFLTFIYINEIWEWLDFVLTHYWIQRVTRNNMQSHMKRRRSAD